MTTYVLEMRSTAQWSDVRYREYTTSAKKAELFQRVPKIQFTDSGHGIVPCVREHHGRREPRNMLLQEHVVDSIKEMTKQKPAIAALPAPAGVEVTVHDIARIIEPGASGYTREYRYAVELAEELRSAFTILAKPAQRGHGS